MTTDSPAPTSKLRPLGDTADSSNTNVPVFADDQWAAAKREHWLRVGAEALPTRVNWRLVAIFVTIAFAAGWLVCLPFWFAGGLDRVDAGLFQGLLFGLMATPSLAALIVVFAIQRPKHPVSMLGLRFRPAGRTIALMAIAWFTPPIAVFAGLLLAGAVGALSIDLSGEAFRTIAIEAQQQLGADEATLEVFRTLPGGALIAINLAFTLTISVFVSSIPAFGEELGWRGWLLPNLRPLGTWPAMLVSTVIWGLWHAPIILLGYNFQDRGPVGLLLMIGFCVSIGLFVSWVRLRSASVYPAAIAHGSINAVAGTIPTLFATGVIDADPKVALVGWTLWVPFLALAGVHVLLGQFRKQPLPGLTLAESALALQRRDEAANADAPAAPTAPTRPSASDRPGEGSGTGTSVQA